MIVVLGALWLAPWWALLNAGDGVVITNHADTNVTVMLNTVALTLAASLGAGVLGLSLAAIIEFLPRASRATALGLFSIPFILPPYLIGLAWAPILLPTGLVIQR